MKAQVVDVFLSEESPFDLRVQRLGKSRAAWTAA